jgi:hypothetical protein
VIVEKSLATFNLRPSNIILKAQFGLALVVSIVLLGLPVVWWARLLALFITAAAIVLWFRQWQAQEPEVLRCLGSERWTLGDIDLLLQPRQFVMRNLVILYFKTTDDALLVRVLPADSMPAEQHRLLRKLLLAR